MLVGSGGIALAFFGTGGVAINVRVGDPAFGWEADHIEPGVSLVQADPVKKGALANLACVGNVAVVVKAAMNDVEKIVGSRGIVTGKHGGAERLIVWFDSRTVAAITPDDVIRIEAWGINFGLPDWPELLPRSLSPELFDRLPIREESGKLRIGVSRILPGSLMGSGVGSGNTLRGDVDIQSTDAAAVKLHGLDGLRLGDIVAIADFDTTFGASMRQGAVTIGVIIHGASRLSGHGPGVTTLLSAADARRIEAYETPVNLAELYGLAGR